MYRKGGLGLKKIVITLFGATLLLAACGGNNDVSGNVNDNSTEAVQGEDIYMANCAGCHGENLEGAAGPAIGGLSKDDVLKAIEEGPGTMPAGIVSGQEAEDVAAWISQQK